MCDIYINLTKKGERMVKKLSIKQEKKKVKELKLTVTKVNRKKEIGAKTVGMLSVTGAEC
jgi:hypothetical protein